MTIIKLTDTDNTEILVNFQNVTHVVPDKSGSTIYTIKESGYFIISVNENIDEIMNRLGKQ
jgi:hypothetical protein